MSTTDGTVRSQQTRAAVETAEEYKQQPPPRPNSTFFPLGYKDAAYQWVSGIASSRSAGTAELTITISGQV